MRLLRLWCGYLIIGLFVLKGLLILIDICWRGRKMNKKENLETKNLNSFAKPSYNRLEYWDLLFLFKNNKYYNRRKVDLL